MAPRPHRPDPPTPGGDRSTPNPQHPQIAASLRRYWRANIRIMLVLLAIWALVGLGCGVLWAEQLNAMGSIGGFPLGFWFAQQGSIIVFVLLILIYAVLLNRLDKKHHDEIAPLMGKKF